MKQNFFKLFILLLWPFTTATAQDNVNMKFGKPTKEEMQMTVYEADPNAEAVVLCRGEVPIPTSRVRACR